MKMLKKITLGEGMKVLSNPELKHLKGGDTKYFFCHCKGNTGEGFDVDSCEACKRECGAAGMQNCNYVII